MTDDSPFFLFFWKPRSHFQPGALGNLTLPWGSPPARLADLGSANIHSYALVSFLLLVPFGLGLAALVAVAVLARAKAPPGVAEGGPAGGRLSWPAIGYFSLLGSGFMLFEISISQRLVLLLGHPAYSISIVLFSFLIFGAIGSTISQAVPAERLRSAQIFCALAVAAAASGATLLYPFYVVHFLGQSQTVRTLASVLWVLPLATLAGMPFPMGLRQIPERQVAWVWAMNGCGSVAGSSLAVALGLLVGFNSTTFIGATAYLLVAAVTAMGAFPRPKA